MENILAINWWSIVQFGAIIFGTILVSRFFQYLLRKRLVKKNDLNLKDPTRLKFFSHVISALIYLIGFSWALETSDKFHSLASSLIAGAGILTVAIGFASQNALSNIISGLFIVLFRPFRVNDRLLIKGNIHGTVEDITLRHTIIKDLENKLVIIPNATMNSEIITNYTLNNDPVKKSFDLLVSFDSNIDNLRALIGQLVYEHDYYLNKDHANTSVDFKTIVPVTVQEINEKGIRLQVTITAFTIQETNKIIQYVLEKLISNITQHGAFFVRSGEFSKLDPESDSPE